MTLFEKKLENLEGLYLEQMKDLYDAEQQILEALPEVEEKVANQTLKKAVSDYQMQVKGQIARLEQSFKELGIKPETTKCKAMQGLVEEEKQSASRDAVPHVRDAGIIASTQRVQHYKIAGYGSVAAFAHHLKNRETEKLHSQSLKEEKNSDKLFSEIALDNANQAEAALA